ncbi:NAD(P)/FAD-dependent oxidoreductase [Streptomyces abyssomicinicus]|uniref:NAD(P)/FAD-dependent oxidoreductase n=1 Tax=Streptomyces abyssomicinicus TaxID=574929 RepID=UPI001250C082|nr:NAD(P)/FAD-dependent oxidoreductase [Streptomyces abyssomicinicus]
MRAPHRVVVVGASLAGLSAARTLRAEGWTGSLTVVGAEPHLPYDRPPLSKEVLAREEEPELPRLPLPAGPDARWLLGRRAVRLDTSERRVTLSDGTGLAYDGLVIATGAHARTPRAGGPAPPGVFTLRGWDDALAVRARLGAGRSLVVVGGGFLGSEIAAAARARGTAVTLVEAAEQPLTRALGRVAGAYVAGLQEEAGITVRTGTRVTGFRTALGGGLCAVELTNASAVPADTAVVALGGVPATDWLAGSGLLLDQGVCCDPFLRALRGDGSPAPGVVAAGDAAKVPYALAGGSRVTTGHWADALAQGAAAASTLLHGETAGPYDTVPSFWADLHGARFRSVGLPSLADEATVLEHDPAGRRLEIAYHHRGSPVGALTAGRTSRLAAYRAELASAARSAGVCAAAPSAGTRTG